MTGTIKTLKENGFGFITVEGMEKDLFFHRNALVGVNFEDLKDGENGTKVSFDVEDTVKNGEKKRNAINVKLA